MKEKYRSRAPVTKITRSFRTPGIRIRYVRDYIKWQADTQLAALGASDPRRETLEANMNRLVKTLNTISPISQSGSQRQGLTPAAKSRLLQVIDPASPENPWREGSVRKRNHLVIRLLLELGIRRGELLGIKLSDINFRSNEVTILRRADDKADPRTYQPQAKTLARLLPLSEDLAALVHEYIFNIRAHIRNARRHEFLVVAIPSGSPLTLGAVNKIFHSLRDRFPALLKEVNAHILRHTWNDDFSESMDAAGVSETEEQRMRLYLMGWSKDSKMPALYTKRTTAKRAKKASLEMQSKTFGRTQK